MFAWIIGANLKFRFVVGSACELLFARPRDRLRDLQTGGLPHSADRQPDDRALDLRTGGLPRAVDRQPDNRALIIDAILMSLVARVFAKGSGR